MPQNKFSVNVFQKSRKFNLMPAKANTVKVDNDPNDAINHPSAPESLAEAGIHRQ